MTDYGYLGIRLTLDDTIHSHGATQVLGKFREMYGIKKMILGIEEKDKFGKETNKHVHAHMIVEEDFKKKDTYQKKFRELVKERFGSEIKGNKMYSIKYEIDVEDEVRFMRYPLKQQENIKKFMYSGYKEEEVELMRKMAADEYQIQVRKNNESLNSYLDKSSFKGKCYEKLTQDGVKTHKEFVIGFIGYYIEKSKVPPFGKLDDYWIDYQILTKIISVEEYYNIKYIYNGS